MGREREASGPLNFAVVVSEQNVFLAGIVLPHGHHPDAIPGSRTNSSQAARQHAAESPKLSSLRAARRQPAIFMLGSWQTSNALALQASLCGSVTHRLHQFQPRETRPMHRE